MKETVAWVDKVTRQTNSKVFFIFYFILKLSIKSSVVGQACNSSSSGGRGKRIMNSKLAWAKTKKQINKQTNTKKHKNWGIAQLVQNLPNKHVVLSSIPIANNNKKRYKDHFLIVILYS
jgi:hypothetical protein